MNQVNIEISRTGFPVKIGSIELWFDSSIENLKRFFNIDKLAQDKLKEAQEKAKHVHFPEKIESIDDVDSTMVDAAFDLNKEFIAAQYDIIFGDGTFKRIYQKYPDIIALEQALDVVGVAIAKRIDEQEAERAAQVEEKKKEYLNKKALKK
ncbi:hypothetical protein [Robertmurraya siralis]|uniref:hypothetical protein n=1 Tax=Robertmurraya siralis TaxID=77777 RepID=UPI0010F94396|nr:hypothetical protein [Robertmurraya siralis]